MFAPAESVRQSVPHVQLEYRANFVAGVAVETGWMLIKLLYVAVVYRVGADIGVLTPDHILLFVEFTR